MRQLLEEEIETIDVYMVRRDNQQKPEPEQRWPRLAWPNIEPTWDKVQQYFMASIACVMLAGFVFAGVGAPLFTIKTLRIPLVALPAQVFMTSVNIVPTGVQAIPAVAARGTLTVYNGSILQESLPAGFIVTSAGGVEIETDQAVTIPAADPPSFGVASVPAHAVQPGAAGNIAAYSIRQQDGTSLTIKNLAAFTGGVDASTRQIVTTDDVNNATTEAREKVEGQPVTGLTVEPCSETVNKSEKSVSVTRECQTYTYTLPKQLRIVSMRIIAHTVVVEYKVYSDA